MAAKLLIALVGLYRKYISPLKKAPTCRFTPTCSAYAAEALSEWGAVRGLGLALLRILRCNPFCRGGGDFVRKNPKRHPDSGTFRVRLRGRLLPDRERESLLLSLYRTEKENK